MRRISLLGVLLAASSAAAASPAAGSDRLRAAYVEREEVAAALAPPSGMPALKRGGGLLLQKGRRSAESARGGGGGSSSSKEVAKTKVSLGRVVGGAVVRTAIHVMLLGAAVEGSFSLLRIIDLSPDLEAIVKLVVCTCTVFLSGFLMSAPEKWASELQLLKIDDPLDKDWYASLKRPSWHPPYWVFPLCWIPLKILQVFALYKIWATLPQGSETVLCSPVLAFLTYKCLGDTWNRVMFSRRAIASAGAVIVLYVAALVGTLASFYGADPAAAALLAPTLAWVAVASSLNIKMVMMNRE
jgi:benzodiazapine receptor